MGRSAGSGINQRRGRAARERGPDLQAITRCPCPGLLTWHLAGSQGPDLPVTHRVEDAGEQFAGRQGRHRQRHAGPAGLGQLPPASHPGRQFPCSPALPGCPVAEVASFGLGARASARARRTWRSTFSPAASHGHLRVSVEGGRRDPALRPRRRAPPGTAVGPAGPAGRAGLPGTATPAGRPCRCCWSTTPTWPCYAISSAPR